MRILITMMQLESGGAQTVAIDLHRGLIERGIDSRLVFLYEKDGSVFPQRDYETLLKTRPKTLQQSASMISSLRSLWTEWNPTIIISNTHYCNVVCAAIKATGAPGKLIPVHHTPFDTFPILAQVLDRSARSLRLYGHEISVSGSVQASLPKGRVSRDVILNGQSLRRSVSDKSSARANFGLPDNCYVIGAVGRLSEQKNHKFLVDLINKIPDAHLAILGEGPLRIELEERVRSIGISDKVSLIGAVVHERVPDFLAALDLFAMPSLFEGMSIAMLEALAAGVPFIGSDVPTIADVVNVGDGGAGLVLPLRLQDWLNAIQQLRGDPRSTAALSARERRRAADFSIEHMVDQYLVTAQGREP